MWCCWILDCRLGWWYLGVGWFLLIWIVWLFVCLCFVWLVIVWGWLGSWWWCGCWLVVLGFVIVIFWVLLVLVGIGWSLVCVVFGRCWVGWFGDVSWFVCLVCCGWWCWGCRCCWWLGWGCCCCVLVVGLLVVICCSRIICYGFCVSLGYRCWVGCGWVWLVGYFFGWWYVVGFVLVLFGLYLWGRFWSLEWGVD